MNLFNDLYFLRFNSTDFIFLKTCNFRIYKYFNILIPGLFSQFSKHKAIREFKSVEYNYY